ncbi:hypothetical protein ACIBHX_52175 [Nonomuraea sp. NPDC050536]|uniref:hypothetical protein n=1 Tax=Nonomuraea sp. NPDC050536 TaxID=3364366 RepID=UPI0037C8721D
MADVPHDVAPGKEVWQRASECWSRDIDERIERLEDVRARFTSCAGCGCLSFAECRLVSP